MSASSLSVLCLLSHVVFSDTVRVIGLFPCDRHEVYSHLKSNLPVHWTTQSVAMFETAIILADRYGLRVHGEPFNSSVYRTSVSANGFVEFDLICDLISEQRATDIVGVVGPASSSSSRLLGMLAAQIHLPLVSYAATNGELSNVHSYKTFFRTSPSDEHLAQATVQVFQMFAWKTCILIYEDDDYGYGGLKIFSENPPSNVTIQERITFDARCDCFNKNLRQAIERSASRVILVWANQSSTSRIMRHALDANLVGGQYIWLLVNEIDPWTFPPSVWPTLQGLLSIVPIVPNESQYKVNQTLQTEALRVWRKLLEQNSTKRLDLSRVSPFAMYTFDATWILIQALSKLSKNESLPSLNRSDSCFRSYLQNYSAYHRHLENTDFFGVSGLVRFSKNTSNDRDEGVVYGLKNVEYECSNGTNTKGKLKYVRKMIWCQVLTEWQDVPGLGKKSIVWPNGSNGEVPPDYRQLRGQNLRIHVIESPPFVMIRRVAKQNSTQRPNIQPSVRGACKATELPTTEPGVYIYGFVADFISELMVRMHFDCTIVLAPTATSYHRLVSSVAGERPVFDLVIADVRITSQRLETVDFSVPIHENTFRLLVRENSFTPTSNIFSCLNPFAWDVWMVIFAALMYSGVIIYFFEPKEEENSAFLSGVCKGICRAMSTIAITTGSSPYKAAASRLTLLSLNALCIILIAIYTANLSSFLTLSRSRSSLSGIDDIKNGRIPFDRIGIINNSAVSDYYIQNISTTYKSLSSIREMYEGLLNHSIDASMWDSAIIEYAVANEYCDRLTTVGVGFVRSSFGIALQKNWPYKRDLDSTILKMRESETFGCLETRWFTHWKCPGSTDGDDPSKAVTFSLEIMSGVFVLFFAVTLMAVGVHLWYCRETISSKARATVRRLSKIVL